VRRAGRINDLPVVFLKHLVLIVRQTPFGIVDDETGPQQRKRGSGKGRPGSSLRAHGAQGNALDPVNALS